MRPLLLGPRTSFHPIPPRSTATLPPLPPALRGGGGRCPSESPPSAPASSPRFLGGGGGGAGGGGDGARGDGVWSSVADEKKKGKETKVVVLWDLDNKPPRGPPYEAAVALRQLAGLFGRVLEVSAYANRHAFLHLPQWVLEQRRERRLLEQMERKGLSPAPADPYVCGVCGRKCRTHADLRKHFRQLHERERQKKLARMRSLKSPKKRRSYRERFISGNAKYEEAARDLLKPKVGYGLASELRRAGVFVKMVADKPQAADAALKRQVHHSMARGVDWLFLVSDDSDFSEMLRRAREADLRTAVVGDGRTALSREADLWFPWTGVENGEVGEEMALKGRPLVAGEMELSFSFSEREEPPIRRCGATGANWAASSMKLCLEDRTEAVAECPCSQTRRSSN
ncbi:unnamed protein product [Spirodela intermedia]|uniref:C2H2-type domain-containing protein n=1 Tax=Spirodela intermedia TaxID=51605 RepID=A0A7I8JS49_SPIIN|nr:unnamed protein product [Spirodela intermedia]CAA6672575.1 unnamed protein product [Spirodela intermedia]